MQKNRKKKMRGWQEMRDEIFEIFEAYEIPPMVAVIACTEVIESAIAMTRQETEAEAANIREYVENRMARWQ